MFFANKVSQKKQQMVFPVKGLTVPIRAKERNLTLTPSVIQKDSFSEVAFRKSSLVNANTIKVGEISGCLRKSFLDRQDDAPFSIKDVISQDRAQLGKKAVEHMLGELHFSKDVDYSFRYKDFDCSFVADFLIDLDGELIVVEAKTVDCETTTPKRSWVRQINALAAIVSKTTGRDVKGKIIAVNINTGWHREFDILMEEETQNMMKKRVEAMINSLSYNTEPHAEIQSFCSTCNHKSHCTQYGTAQKLPKDITKMVEDIQLYTKQGVDIKNKRKLVHEFMSNNELDKAQAGDVLIQRVKPTTTLSIDASSLMKDHPMIYANYSDVKVTSGHIRFI